MPFFDADNDPRGPEGGRMPLGPPTPPAFPVEPTMGETLGAAFRQNNPIVSVGAAIMASRPDETPVPGYDAIPRLVGTPYESLIRQSFDDVNPAQTDARIARFNADQQDRQTLADAGWPGKVASVAAGLTDPTWYIPIAGELSAFGKGLTLAQRLARGAAEGAGRAAVSEGALMASQPDRTAGEAAGDIASSALLMGLIGGALRFLEPAERAGAEQGVTAMRKDLSPGATPESITLGSDLSAAESDQRTMKLSPILPPVVTNAIAAIPGGEAVMNGMRQFLHMSSPSGRTFLNGSLPGKQALGDLAETSLKFTQAAEGVTASTQGTVPISRLVRAQQDRFAFLNRDTLERNFADYRGVEGPIPSRGAAFWQDITGQAAGKMTFDQFKDEVFKSLIDGGEHEVPQVAKAANEVTHQIFEPIHKFASTVIGPDGRPMMAEELEPPRGDKGYAPRLWNKQAIAADPNGFQREVEGWLAEEQARKQGIQDRLQRLQKQHDALGEEQETQRAHLRRMMEEEIVNWRGRTTDEAVAALKKREAEEATREGAKVDRLASANKAVDAAIKKIVESDKLDRTPEEIKALAAEIRNRINVGPDGRLPYDMASGGPAMGYPGERNATRGSLNSRDFAIPTARVLKYVHTDMEHIVPAYLRTIIPDLHLTQRFGDVEMTEQFKKVNEWYDKQLEKEGANTAAIDAARQAEIRDLSAIRDKVRGVYGAPGTEFQRNMGRVARAVGNWNVGLFLGTSVLNRFQDMANATARRGLMGYMRDGFLPMVQGLSRIDAGSAAAREQVKAYGIGLDAHLGHSAAMFWDVVDHNLPGNRFERGLRATANFAMWATGHTGWTNINKQAAAMAASVDFIKMADRIAAGTNSERDIRTMAHAGINPHDAARISEEFEKHHTVVGDTKIPNTGDWNPRLRQIFESAVMRDADIAVITPGMEKPLFLSDPVMSLMGQFKGFSFAAQERILISNLQEADGRTLEGFLHLLGMGALSYGAYSLAAGRQVSERPQDWVKEAVVRAGMLGWMSDANMMQARFFGDKTDAFRLIGADQPLSRTAALSSTEAMLGPTYSLFKGLATGLTNASYGSWSAMDTHKFRQAMFLQNHFLIRQLLDKAEDGINEYLGIKPLDRTKINRPGS